jgi:hypothetical protein
LSPSACPSTALTHCECSASYDSSESIAARIEELAPGRGLLVDLQSDAYKRVDAAIADVLAALRPVVLHTVAYAKIAMPEDRDYFVATRQARFGVDFAAMPTEFEGAWAAAQEPVAKLGALLLERPGPYLAGREPGYGDVRICALVFCFARFDEEALARFLALDEHGGVKKLWHATKAWRPELPVDGA